MGVFLQPLVPTREFPPPVTGTRSWGATGHRLAGRAVNAAVDHIFADASPRPVRALSPARVRATTSAMSPEGRSGSNASRTAPQVCSGVRPG